MAGPSQREQRRRALAALPDGALQAACEAAIDWPRRYGHDAESRAQREDCWSACVATGREQLWHAAVAAVKAREAEERRRQSEALARLGQPREHPAAPPRE
jgi:hypothetical protein